MRPFLLLEDLRFGLLAIRDVGQRAGHAPRPAVGSAAPSVRACGTSDRRRPACECGIRGRTSCRSAGACAGPRPPHGGRADGFAAGTRRASPASRRARSPAAISKRADRKRCSLRRLQSQMPSLLARTAYSKRSSLVRKLVLDVLAVADEAMGHDDRDQHQRDADGDIDQHQQVAGLPRRLRSMSPLIASPTRSQLAIQRPYADHGRLQVGGLRLCRRRRSSATPGPRRRARRPARRPASHRAAVVVMNPTPRKRRYRSMSALGIVGVDAGVA